MGIKDLYSILSKKHPNVFLESEIKSFENKVVAIDILTYLYKYIRSVGEDEWINYILLLFYKLQKCNIKIICVFDGKNYPIEKRNEHEKRNMNIKKLEEKYENVVSLKKEFLNSYDTELELYITKFNNIISKHNKSYIDDPKSIDKKGFLKKIDEVEIKLSKQCLKITEKYFDILKDLINTLNMQYITADGEAEKLCSYLCIKGIVDAVLSEDSDVLAYGTPIFIFRINLGKNLFTIIKMDELLNNLSMTLSQFQDFCILSGCDYNSRIKIKSKNNRRDTGIGVTKAYNLIKKYITLEMIKEKENHDLTSLNYINCRKIFMLEKEIMYNIQYNNLMQPGVIDYDILDNFLIKYKCNFKIDKWKKINDTNLFVDIMTKIEELKIE